jgi:hypothetical protein
MAISRLGKVSICVRFDPKNLGIIGDANHNDLLAIWNSSKRKEWIRYHLDGRRDEIPLCSLCHYWGIPTSYESKKHP